MAKRVTLYQKPGCKTCGKTRDWLQDRDDVEVLERDIQMMPPSREMLERHVRGDGDGLRRFVNPRSGPYRREGLSSGLPGRDRLIDLMEREPDLIRRPVAVRGSRAVFGHDVEALDELLR